MLDDASAQDRVSLADSPCQRGPPVTSPLPPSSSAPFALPPAQGPDARAHALLIHGFSGTPYEVRPVGDALAQVGLSATGILLAGHGTTPRDLGRVRAETWKAESEAAFRALPRTAPRVIVGASMGGLLALWLAHRFPHDVTGIVLLAPALLYHPVGTLGLKLARHGLWRAVPLLRKSGAGSDVGDPAARALNPSYPSMAVHGLKQLDRLRGEVRALLPRIRVPVCAIHGARDHTIHPAASRLVVARIGSPRAERHLLPHSQHVLGIDVERDLVAALAVRFLEDVLRSARSSAAPVFGSA